MNKMYIDDSPVFDSCILFIFLSVLIWIIRLLSFFSRSVCLSFCFVHDTAALAAAAAASLAVGIAASFAAAAPVVVVVVVVVAAALSSLLLLLLLFLLLLFPLLPSLFPTAAADVIRMRVRDICFAALAPNKEISLNSQRNKKTNAVYMTSTLCTNTHIGQKKSKNPPPALVAFLLHSPEGKNAKASHQENNASPPFSLMPSLPPSLSYTPPALKCTSSTGLLEM